MSLRLGDCGSGIYLLNAGLEVEDFACGAQCSSRTGQSSRIRVRGAKVQSLRCKVEVVRVVPRVFTK